MREVLYNYKTTQRYYDRDISFIKHQGTKNNVKRKGVFILPVAHLPRRSEKHGLCKIGGRGEGGGGEGDKQGVLRVEVPMANRPFPSYKILSLSKQGLLQNLSYAFCETQAN